METITVINPLTNEEVIVPIQVLSNVSISQDGIKTLNVQAFGNIEV